MAKARNKSSTNDKVSTGKASIAEFDEEIAGLFKPKSRKTRSTDEPSVKEARRQSLRTAVEKHKAGVSPASVAPTLREKAERRKETKWRVRLDRERKQRKRLFETAPAGGKQHRVAVREWWGAVSEVLRGIKTVTDLEDPLRAIALLPYELFAMLAGQFGYLAVGQIPDPIKHVGGVKGRKAPGPGEIEDIRWAVTYVRAVHDGLVRGRKPVAVVCRLYKLRDKRIVRTWRQKYKPFPSPDAWVGSSLRNFLIDAARRYRQANARTWTVIRKTSRKRPIEKDHS